MKDLEKMKKAELQAVAKEQGVTYARNATVEQIIEAIEKNRSNGKQAGTFKMLKTEYHERADARVAKNFPTVTGELKIDREIEWQDERNKLGETLIFFRVGGSEECLIFSGALVAAAKKAGVELFSEVNGELFMNQGFLVSLAPRSLTFDNK